MVGTHMTMETGGGLRQQRSSGESTGIRPADLAGQRYRPSKDERLDDLRLPGVPYKIAPSPFRRTVRLPAVGSAVLSVKSGR